MGPVRRRIRDVLASGRDERAFPSPSSPLVGGRLAQKIINAWCSFVTVQRFLGEFIEIVFDYDIDQETLHKSKSGLLSKFYCIIMQITRIHTDDFSI